MRNRISVNQMLLKNPIRLKKNPTQLLSSSSKPKYFLFYSLNISNNGDGNGVCFFPILTPQSNLIFFTIHSHLPPIKIIFFPSHQIISQNQTLATDGYNAGIGVMGSKLLVEEDGTVVPVTVVGFREGNIIIQIITLATDGYDAGTTIGKGFQGGIKRYNFKRGQMTHGSKSHRALGSIRAGTTLGRVYRGKKMPGRMGGTKTKIRKLKIVKVDKELNVVMIKGAFDFVKSVYQNCRIWILS